MNNVIKKEVARISIFVVSAIIIGLISGYPLSSLLVVLGSYFLIFFYNLSQFIHWLNSSKELTPPSLIGIWEDLALRIHKDRKKFRLVQERSKSTFQRVTDISNAVQDSIVIIDHRHHIEWYNDKAQKTLHIQTEDRGLPLLNTLRNPALNHFLKNIHHDECMELRLLKHPNKVFEVSATPFGNNMASLLLIFRDITNLNLLEQTRKDFVANISHELRTPLTVINGYIDNFETLLEGDKWTKIIHQIRSQSNRITALAEDLTMLSKLESDKFQLTKENINLPALLKQVVNDTSLLSSSHKITLHSAESLKINGNYQQLYSAFSNLVINAIRHNPQGCSITIDTTIQGNSIKVIIADNGKGIANRHISRLTERFYRVDTDRNSSTGGTGLGLAIVKHVLQHHNANLLIESTEGSGATFTSILPKAPSS